MASTYATTATPEKTQPALPFPTAAARQARAPLPRTVPEQTNLQEVLHERDWDLRTHVIRSLAESYYRPLQRRASNIASCATTARFYVEPTSSSVRPWLNRCRDRLCPFCSRHRTAETAGKLHKLLLSMKHPRQIILTIQSTDQDLATQLTFLRKSLARLRRSATWRKLVAGGSYTIEITANEQTHQWHPHVHIIYDGAYFPQKLLRGIWNRITLTAEVVWISDVHDLAGMAKELCKYVGKPAKLKSWSPSQIREYATATSGARLLHNFGNCHGRKLDDRDSNPAPDPDQFTVSLARIVFLAAHGDATSIRLAQAITTRWPEYAPFILHTMPQLAPEKTQGEKTLKILAQLRGQDPARPRPPPRRDAGNTIDGLLLAIFRRFRLDQEDGTHKSIDLAVQHGYRHRG